ncbi:MAG: Sporulation related domain [Rhodobacteraceae bacterium HLUCCA12]|nr:MAG: Sporulation related domain [Rhodobacteraceae bacterium HLUCCA12]
MARAGFRDIPLRSALAMGLVLGLALSGCGLTSTEDGSGASRAGGSLDMLGSDRETIERDIEVPEVFSMEEEGLWDGRPSLGGVWVAHPEVENPERVLIRNTQTGESVIGALFRRERENPGPRFQISSEAANALGILPGAPTTIDVVALRLEEVATDLTLDEGTDDDEPVDEASDEDGRDVPSDTAAAPAEDQPESADETVAITEADDTEEPRRGFLARLFGSDPDPEPDQAGAEISQTALAPVGDDPAAPPARPSNSDTDEARAPQVDDAPADPGESALERPFVQIGIFSIEDNASNARNQMRDAGLGAEIRPGRTDERAFWRVVVGPAADSGERRQMLERVRALGFADAYAVTN